LTPNFHAFNLIGLTFSPAILTFYPIILTFSENGRALTRNLLTFTPNFRALSANDEVKSVNCRG